MVRGNGFKPALIILRVKEDGHAIVKLGYVELACDVKLDKKINDLFPPVERAIRRAALH
jgi:hypothetical protein